MLKACEQEREWRFFFLKRTVPFGIGEIIITVKFYPCVSFAAGLYVQVLTGFVMEFIKKAFDAIATEYDYSAEFVILGPAAVLFCGGLVGRIVRTKRLSLISGQALVY